MTSGDAERRARFDVLAREAYVPLRRYLARRTDPAAVDDVLADTLLAMWRRLDDIPDDAALPWCYGAARRCLANARRAEDRRARLLRRLAGLADADRDILRLWAWEQLEPREMAVVLGITANAASIRLHRATKRLRHQLGRTEDAHGKDDGTSGHLPPRQEGPREDTEAPR